MQTPAPIDLGKQSQPDFSLPRKWRIENLEKGLERARLEGRRGAVRFFEKEIQIQKAYLEIES